MQPLGSPLAPGTILEGRYLILKVLGAGGMGRVYLAKLVKLNKLVAIKENTDPDPSIRNQFQREAQILARLSHSNLPQVNDSFDDLNTGRQHFVMEYIDGEDLEAMVKRVGPLPEANVLGWIDQILNALIYLHSQPQPIIHRDIKPANIKITPQGKAVLVDFGIAKVSGPGTLTGAHNMGTLRYAPPEQFSPEMHTDQRSDIYSLGATLYNLLTGNILPATPPRQFVPSLSPHVEKAIMRAMETDMAQRWQSAGEFRAALQRPSVMPFAPQPFPAATLSWVWLGGLVIGVIVLIAIVVMFGGGGIVPAMSPTTAAAVLPTRTNAVPATSATLPTVLPTNVPTIAPSVIPIMPKAIPTLTRTRIPAMPTDTSTAMPAVDTGRLIDSTPMTFIPSGEFLMGSTDQDIAKISALCRDCSSGEWAGEQPQHRVYVDAFQLDQHEVSNAQYQKCVSAGLCALPFDNSSYTRKSYYGNPQFNNYPVIYVSWNDALTYCQWAGKRLPTEAEWEKAARGTDGRLFPWGNNVDGTRFNFCDKNCPFSHKEPGVDDGSVDTATVTSYPSGTGPYGNLNMLGNVWEWTADWYDSNYYAISPFANPPGPAFGQAKVIRGGSWYNKLSTHAASRYSYAPNLSNSKYVGFRCAK
ncbi:MAG: SUMF1/EgtB/PvdO family nonheme iron enzyme [Anaerolineae bacterium]